MSDSMPPPTLPSPDEDPDAAMAAAVALRRLAERLEADAVRAAVERGWTWANIAESLGVTRQAAHKRYARSIRANTEKGEDK